MHLSTLSLHRAPLTSLAMRLALVLFGVLGLSVIASQLTSSNTADAAAWLHFQRGYSVQSGWLCYGWNNGAYHCTHHWHRDAAGRLISDNRAWVPNYGTTTADPAVRLASVTHQAPAAPRTSSAPALPSNPGQQGVINEIRAVFGPYANQALAVARCESGYNPYAVNRSSDAEGVFQFLASTWAGTSYARYSRMNASANIHAAYQIFRQDGFTWREWSCKP